MTPLPVRICAEYESCPTSCTAGPSGRGLGRAFVPDPLSDRDGNAMNRA